MAMTFLILVVHCPPYDPEKPWLVCPLDSNERLDITARDWARFATEAEANAERNRLRSNELRSL